MDFKLLLQIFWVFTKIAMFSWGGGPASLGLMQRETVALGWVTPEEFADNIALSNALPGPTAPQASAFVGYKLAGGWGALSAVVGTTVPTTLLMFVFISTFFTFKDSPYIKAAITGMRPFVVGLLVWTAYQVGTTVFGLTSQSVWASMVNSWDKWLIALASFLILTFFADVSPIWLVIATAVIGLIFYR